MAVPTGWTMNFSKIDSISLVGSRACSWVANLSKNHIQRMALVPQHESECLLVSPIYHTDQPAWKGPKQLQMSSKLSTNSRQQKSCYESKYRSSMSSRYNMDRQNSWQTSQESNIFSPRRVGKAESVCPMGTKQALFCSNRLLLRKCDQLHWVHQQPPPNMTFVITAGGTIDFLKPFTRFSSWSTLMLSSCRWGPNCNRQNTCT